jgi:hypothetical protein
MTAAWRLAAMTVPAVLLALASLPALAQLYVCTDARGRTISSDRPPPECADRQIRELRSDGSVRRVIEPPITPEQIAARDAEEKRRREEAELRREQMRRDLMLLEAYANEQEIESTRNRALADRQRIIERAIERRENLDKERKKLDIEAEFYPSRELPERLKRGYETVESLKRSEEKIIADVRADMARINERFDAESKRYRELVSSGATPRPLTGTPGGR